jgi:hypothetical protein
VAVVMVGVDDAGAIMQRRRLGWWWRESSEAEQLRDIAKRARGGSTSPSAKGQKEAGSHHGLAWDGPETCGGWQRGATAAAYVV